MNSFSKYSKPYLLMMSSKEQSMKVITPKCCQYTINWGTVTSLITFTTFKCSKYSFKLPITALSLYYWLNILTLLKLKVWKRSEGFLTGCKIGYSILLMTKACSSSITRWINWIILTRQLLKQKKMQKNGKSLV